ncbi:Lipopolysaccharide-responsive and beige-like anchor protein [Chelonia mydas]|uniref:Lipopolysaccharide-responsive and beige-like anchor protein n=1 Tax=Chelonia mydas TaxID=8469 RepID=M7BV02_CHEMY|nr:Lipopolysaccharide-responsive and beige-like anchor protein [Chelonia mydas]
MASEDKQVLQPTGDGGGGKGGGSAAVGSTLQPLNPGVPIRGIRMKFAVLTGLVEVGEVSNRDIVETVFNLNPLTLNYGGSICAKDDSSFIHFSILSHAENEFEHACEVLYFSFSLLSSVPLVLEQPVYTPNPVMM